MTVLLREAIGDRLRHARTNQRRTLREVSRTARVSLGYLSEVERGRKEASSELLAAICDALELPLSELLHHVASDIGAVQQTPDTVPDTVPDGRSDRGKLEGGRVLPSTLSDDLSDLRLQPMLTHRLTSKIGETPKAVVAA
ncbi:helix-turn-helix domain-containing protein [Lentzea sp. NBC_00516]|jgi:transcriptional regulator with XRE-family HTH domain|uniref:Helix-turn-helix transcriptional regulator n=1 Tax=Lentzea sokolovensis TaxID=3095429 RepID=A0ABU4V0D8_9PSEU|nr:MULTISPECIES: helix-turn-helix transcriptional regulator [unclassified Lentzea]MDX8145241.1 helix-turn-helix transcriptional regulator [Lentzea sp. BCCO 10_0061]WUD24463.1 helix-turn-helix domain-containing protein [Lentzea sp. NBC_00516]